MEPAPEPTAEEKAMVDKILIAAMAKGVKLLYPTLGLSCDSSSRDLSDAMREMWGDNGTFRTVRTLCFSDLIELTGIDIGDLDEDNLDNIVYEEHEALFEAPTGYPAGCETEFCFWSDDNPYPGTKAEETETSDVESS